MSRSAPLTRRHLLASSVILAAAGHLATAAPARAGGGLRAAFVYIGSVEGDLWSLAHDEGRRAMAARTGIETAFTASVTPADAERVLRGYARQGYDAIFSTTYDFVEATLRVARDFPGVIFEQATGVRSAPNLGTYNGRIEQAWYLAGIAAGAATTAGRIGYVAPFPIPEVVRHINAFTLGVRAVNPAALVAPRWISTWFDPPVETAAARALAGEGADVIATEADSDAGNRAADALGLPSIGYNAVPPGATGSMLTAPVWHWDVFYERVVRDILNRRWSNAPVWWGLETGLFGLAPVSAAVPADARQRIDAARTQIANGALQVFAGPLSDNAGAVRVPAGRVMTDAELLSVDWLVEGVAGSLPSAGSGDA